MRIENLLKMDNETRLNYLKIRSSKNCVKFQNADETQIFFVYKGYLHGFCDNGAITYQCEKFTPNLEYNWRIGSGKKYYNHVYDFSSNFEPQ